MVVLPFLFNKETCMCIRTLKKGNRVVGLSISGKNFMLDKQVCHALALEEGRADTEIKTTQECIQKLRKDLVKKPFHGSSDLLKVSLKFNESGEVDHVSAQVEFTGRLETISDNQKDEYVHILEEFLKAHNQAVLNHKSEIESRLKTIIAPKA